MTFGEDNTEVPGDGMFLKTHFSPTNPLNKIDLTELGIILGRWGKRLKKKKSHKDNDYSSLCYTVGPCLFKASLSVQLSGS